MIRIQPRPEPADFDARVRTPGLRALRKGKDPLPDYWRRCALQLWESYEGVCAYLAVYIPRGTGARAVEHLVPKSKRRELAYEWSNYRLACTIMNSRKGVFEDVLDPFEVEDGWFVLDLSFMGVDPNPALSRRERKRVQDTIDRLDLDGEECRRARGQFYDMYLEGELNLEGLQKLCPFVFKEVVRQGMGP